MASQVILELDGLEQGALQAASAMEKLTESQRTALKAVKRSLAAFDTIQKLKTGSSTGSSGKSCVKKEKAEAEETAAQLPGWLAALERFGQRVQELWQQWVQPLLGAAAQAAEGLGQVVRRVYDTVVEPILSALQQGLSSLWAEHLAPLWESVQLCLQQAALTLLQLWNSVLQPLTLWVVETFGPALGQVGSFLVGLLTQTAGFAADLVRLAVQSLTGLLSFGQLFAAQLGGCFQGVGKVVTEVFQGMWNVAVTAVNGVISCVNGLVRGMTAALNTVINALNRLRVDIPDWVPEYGGKSFGFRLDTLPAPQIPHLATGAVIPANSPFLAVLGDQKQGTNIEAPLDTLVEAFRAAQTQQNVTVRFMGNLAQLGRVLAPVVEQEQRRLGTSLLG